MKQSCLLDKFTNLSDLYALLCADIFICVLAMMRVIKCLKGVWWMPRHAQAMKDVARCDKPWGAVSKL